MQYIYSDNPTNLAALDASTNIIKHLEADEHVLLLLSGGSGIDIALKLQSLLARKNLTSLYVTLTDERYGELDNSDENWRQLLDAGFALPGANLYRPLVGKDIIETTNQFNNWLDDQISAADYRIGIFGIGSDNHTAGIKPNSQPAGITKWAYSYNGDDFERITVSTATIEKLNKIVAQASGVAKLEAIKQLFSSDSPIDSHPNQALKSVESSNFYTDQKIEEAK